MNEVLTELQKKFDGALESFKKSLAKVRTGRANLSVLDSVKVDYYGTMTPLAHVAALQVPDPRLIVVKPWERGLLAEIEKAIRQLSELGVNPTNDGEVIKIPLPPLTEERRKDLVKVVKRIGEEAKVEVRNHRRDANEQLKQLKTKGKVSEDDERSGLKKIQEMLDKQTGKIDELLKKKEAEVMEV